MIRTFASLNQPILKLFCPQQQSLRRIRKPRKPFWLGTAKSKKFIIHDEPILPPEEKAELLRLHANYKTNVKSIRQYLESMDTNDAASIDATTFRASNEEIESSLKANQVWNSECAQLREKRLAQNSLAHEQMAFRVIEEVNEKQLKIQQRVEEMVRIEKENSKDFITRDNLDKKIEECLAVETDYNYAIDLEGNMFTGFETEMKASPLDLASKDRRIEMGGKTE